MSCKIFLVFYLLLFVCCQLCQQNCAALRGQGPGKTNKENKFAEFLKSEENGDGIQVVDTDGKQQKINIKIIDSVFLLAADGVMAALAEVIEKSPNDKFSLLAKFFEIKGNDWGIRAIRNKEDNQWNVQLAQKDLDKTKNSPVIKSFLVVAEKNKIYYITVNGNIFKNIAQLESHASQTEWHVRLVEGNVINDNSKTVGGKKGKTIKWEKASFPKISILTENSDELKQKLNTQPTKPLSCDSFGFVSGDKDEKAYLGMQCNSADNENKNITAVFQLEKSGVTKGLKLLHVDDTKNCHCSLFLWEKQLVMTPTACTGNGGDNQKMMLFDPNTNKFSENNRPIARLQEFLKDKENFVTTKINDTEDVLLFTQQIEKPKNSGKNDVYLWVTNGNRTAKVDTIITEIKGKIDVSILYTNKELFALHKQKTQNSDTLDNTKYDLKRLPELLTKINLILNAWKTTDNEIKKFFKKTDTAETPSFTDRLVGFLSGNGEDNQHWKDENFYENATEINGTRDFEGFKFSGAGAGAKWQIQKENKQDQPYNFAAFGFTLVATVKIDKDVSEKWNSILGVGLGGTNNKTIGLWCSKGVWAVGNGKNTEAAKVTTETCVQGEKYQVVLTMKGNKISVYIDGKLAKGFSNNPIDVQEEEKDITHFYFGVDNAKQNTKSDIESHVTVTHVLLYNRPFEEKDIKNLKECEKTPKVIKNPKEDHGTTAKENEQTSNVPTTLPPGTTGEEKEPSPSRTEDGGVGGGVRVFSLLLAVLCVSAPLLHL